MPRRTLAPCEVAVLKIIQEVYGPQNTVADVFFTAADEGVIFVKLRDGSILTMANLSNLAAQCAEGTIGSAEELKRNLSSMH